MAIQKVVQCAVQVCVDGTSSEFTLDLLTDPWFTYGVDATGALDPAVDIKNFFTRDIRDTPPTGIGGFSSPDFSSPRNVSTATLSEWTVTFNFAEAPNSAGQIGMILFTLLF